MRSKPESPIKMMRNRRKYTEIDEGFGIEGKYSTIISQQVDVDDRFIIEIKTITVILYN